MKRIKRIGVVGTGFIGNGLAHILSHQDDVALSSVLTRRPIDQCRSFCRPDTLTHDLDALVSSSDLIIECSGDVVHGTNVIDAAIKASIPVVTMNSELQVTTGSYFVKKGLITEAEGDQPGSLAAFRENVLQMGFEPLVYGNIKGFLNKNPLPDEMQYWADRQGISLRQVTSFTDGTKMQIEQAFVANAFECDIARPGLIGPRADKLDDGVEVLMEAAVQHGEPISDYVLCPGGTGGIFIVAEHEPLLKQTLRYLKLGEGPFYTLVHNFHLCHLEVMKTVRRVLRGDGVLMNNTHHPRISAAAIAKKELAPGDRIGHGIGSFVVRGEAVRILDHYKHVPIGLLNDVVVVRDVEPGQIITFDDVEMPDSLALNAWREIESSVVEASEEDFRVAV